jgi:hypothetical protein
MLAVALIGNIDPAAQNGFVPSESVRIGFASTGVHRFIWSASWSAEWRFSINSSRVFP